MRASAPKAWIIAFRKTIMSAGSAPDSSSLHQEKSHHRLLLPEEFLRCLENPNPFFEVDSVTPEFPMEMCAKSVVGPRLSRRREHSGIHPRYLLQQRNCPLCIEE